MKIIFPFWKGLGPDFFNLKSAISTEELC